MRNGLNPPRGVFDLRLQVEQHTPKLFLASSENDHLRGSDRTQNEARRLWGEPALVWVVAGPRNHLDLLLRSTLNAGGKLRD